MNWYLGGTVPQLIWHEYKKKQMNLNKLQHNTFKTLVAMSGAFRCVLQTIPFPGKKKGKKTKNESISKSETLT